MKKLYAKSLVFLFVFILMMVQGLGMSTVSAKTEFQANVEALLKEQKFNGSVLLAKNGKIIMLKGYGMANFEKSMPNMPQTIFRMGSMTKPFTAVAILQLEEKGLLHVQDPISTYIPDYPNGDKITIHHLLTMSSGVQDIFALPDLWEWAGTYMPVEKLVNSFKNEPLMFEPGTSFAYSNSGYILLGYIIEKVSGQSYQDYIRDNIYKPANMTKSGYATNYPEKSLDAKGYFGSPDDVHEPEAFIDMSIPYAAGGLSTSAIDMYKWDRALYNKKLLSQASMDKMFTLYNVVYCYGWVTKEPGIFYHPGSIPGFTSMVRRNLNEKQLVVLISNFEDVNVKDLSIALDQMMTADLE